MAENDAELQLRVWKELAISKQILMRSVTDALKLDPKAAQDEIKIALEAAIKRANDADADIRKAQEHARSAVAAAEKKLADTQKALTTSEGARTEALAKVQSLEQQLADARNQSAQEAEKFKQRMAEKEREIKERLSQKEREIKAIHTMLSDSPQNVVKKLKSLQKEKQEEANERKAVEELAATLRKDKNKLEQSIKDMQTAQDNAAKLAASYRELHTQCGAMRDQLKPLVADAKDLPAVPMLDNALLESIEKVGAADEKKAGGKGKR